MDSKEAISKIKVLLGIEKELKFKDVKLNDGVTILSYDGDTPMQGMPIFVITDEGRLPAPDGEHVTEDGTTIVVVGGLIAEVKEAEVEAPEAEAPAAAPVPAAPEMGATKEPKRVIKSQVEEHVFSLEIEGVEPISVDFSSMLKPYIDKIEALEKETAQFKKAEAEHVEFKKEVIALVNEIAEEPAAASVSKESNPFKKRSSKEASQLFKNALK